MITSQAAGDKAGNGRHRVLIVDNNDPLLSSLETLVRDEGFEPRCTWSGREALALIESQPFDLVLVDNHLPDIYYGEFLKLASRRAGRSIVVMQTGKPLSGSIRRHRALGAATVVDKSDLRQIRQVLLARHVRSPPM